MGKERQTTPGMAPWVLLCILAGVFWVAGGPAQGASTLQVSLAPDVASPDPGDPVVFSVVLKNLGPDSALRAWVNVTLDASLSYLSDTAASLNLTGSWRSNGRLHYNFTELLATDNEFKITARVGTSPVDGQVLWTYLAANYTDEAGVPQAEATAQASVTVTRPTVNVTKTPSSSTVDPGSVLTYAIAVRNDGSQKAGLVWLNETLPPETSFVRVRGIPPAWCAGVNCTIPTLNAGSAVTYDLEVTVLVTAERGRTLVNRLTVAYTDEDGTSLAGSVVDAAVQVRAIRDLRLDMAADARVARPGSLVTLTVWYNNTAAGSLLRVWLNESLPVGLAFDSSAPAGNVSGATIRWVFADVPPGSNEVHVRASITASSNGTVLRSVATGEYLDSGGQMGNPINASAVVLVSTAAPVIELAKAAARGSSPVGGTVPFTVWYNNTGVDVAREVVVVDVIPEGTVLTNPSLPQARVEGRLHEWRFADVAPGVHSLSYVLFLEGVPPGQPIFNVVRANFTDGSGRPMPPAAERSAFVSVTAQVPEDTPGSWTWIPWAAALSVGLTAGGVIVYRVFRGLRTIIDEVFLLHSDGLLIKHFTRRVRPDLDSDILGGMLIAVQNFVNDSFMGSEGLQREGRLDELRFGEFRIVLERGRWVIVAAVLSGDPTDRVKGEIRRAIRGLEDAFGDQLEQWSGELRTMEGADRYIRDLIDGRYRRTWRKD